MGCGPNHRFQILCLEGSLRKNSANAGYLNYLHTLNKKDYENVILFHEDLSKLPLYNKDLDDENRVPHSVTGLRQAVRKATGIIISTPQYNGALSPAVKNALDWVIFDPHSEGPLVNRKKVAAMSTSYKTQGQLKDIQIITESNGGEFYKDPFYVNLGLGASKQETGQLISEQIQKKLIIWFRDVVHWMHTK